MCLKHKTKSNDYCKDCKTWICSECKNGFHKDFIDHKLSKEIPKKRNKCIIHDKAIEYYRLGAEIGLLDCFYYLGLFFYKLPNI